MHLLVFTTVGLLPARDIARLTCEFHSLTALTSLDKTTRVEVLNRLEEITVVHFCREKT